MKLLIDTHVLLWYLDDNPKLDKYHRGQIEDGRNEIVVSIASLWEIVIKQSLGKLELPSSLATIEAILRDQGISILPIRTDHLQLLLELPFHHRDPFDRLIISQAISESVILVSDDAHFAKYPVSLLHQDGQVG